MTEPQPAPKQVRRWRWILPGVLLAWLLITGLLVIRMTGRSRATFPEPPPLAAEGLRLHSQDGEELGAWYYPGRPGCPTVVLLHGNGGCRTSCLAQGELARENGCAVLLVTLRAHGDSTGETNDFGYSARHDVVAAVNWVRERKPNGAVVVWGQSLGSAAAIFAAEELGPRVQGYLLECPYRDVWTATRNRTRLYLPPGVEALAYGSLIMMAPLVRPGLGRVSPWDAVADLPPDARALFLAGGNDQRATPAEAEALRDRLGRGELVVIPHADHLQLLQTDPIAYRAAVRRFLLSVTE